MARASSDPLNERLHNISNVVAEVAWTLADVLRTSDSCSRALTERTSKDLKRLLTQVSLELQESPASRIHGDTTLRGSLLSLIDTFNNIIDGAYIKSFIEDSSKMTNVEALVFNLWNPPSGFAKAQIIRPNSVEELGQLLPLLDSCSRMLDNPDYPQSTPSTTISTMSKDAFHGDKNVRALADRLHRSLHKGRPCDLEDHVDKHVSALGECTHAKMELDPRWINRGVENESFFIVLSSNGINQECRVQLTLLDEASSASDKSLLCLLPYEVSKDICLTLIPDESGHLWDIEEQFPAELRLQIQTDAQYGFFTLRELLIALNLPYVVKRVLQLIIARSVLLLLQGPWLGRTSLSLEGITVFCKVENSRPSPFFDKIFIPTYFGSENDTFNSVGGRHNHPFLEIQALAILIGQIDLGDGSADESLDIGWTPPQSLSTIKKLHKACLNEAGLKSGAVQALQFCSSRNVFLEHARRIGTGFPQEDAAFIEDCYLNIVRPLEEDLKNNEWSFEEITWSSPPQIVNHGMTKTNARSAIQPTNKTRYNTRTTRLPPLAEENSCKTRTATIPLPYNESPRVIRGGFDTHGSVATNDQPLETDAWFNKLQDVHKVLNSDRMDPLAEDEVEELIKVAVLDTGIDLTHDKFKKFREDGRLDSGYDFVDEGKGMRDLDGHGTHICHTLFQTAPYIKLYPVRVFEGTEATDFTISSIEKAIYHSIQAWDVDIISMSFAFEQDHPMVKKALEDGRRLSKSQKHVLFFAAASNYRALEKNPIGFPARVTDHVISAFSSTINDVRSDFSPNGIKGHANFSVIGENVAAAWPGETELQRRNGTSCATPIVAGIAALLLDFSLKEYKELRSYREWNEKKNELRETSGMRSVLLRCMTDAKKQDGTYNFLKPWKLFVGQRTDFIAFTIVQALEERYK